MAVEQVQYSMRAIADLHCDLLSYLANVPEAGVFKQDEIGVAVPHLQRGNVKLQVMAAYTDTAAGSAESGKRQLALYQQLKNLSGGFFQPLSSLLLSSKQLEETTGCFTLLAIENASGICSEEDDLDAGFRNLQNIVDTAGPLAYIILTHHYENRFGGGNYATAGLKPDGEVLLDFLDKKKIPVDLSHTSDALAYGILNYIDKKRLDIAVIASHSNFRPVQQHPRNLPDELTAEFIRRRGLIGINFLRNYINDSDPSVLHEHIEYGKKAGAGEAMAFGADFFYTLNHLDPSRFPIYFPGQDDASRYQQILSDLEARGFSGSFCDAISVGNVLNFYNKLAQQ